MVRVHMRLCQIPDTVSAVALARNGYYNAAMAGAIGSQVRYVTLRYVRII